MVNGGLGSFKAQMKRADNSGADYALILGDNEVDAKSIIIKPLRSNLKLDEQMTIPQEQLADFISETLV